MLKDIDKYCWEVLEHKSRNGPNGVVPSGKLLLHPYRAGPLGGRPSFAGHFSLLNSRFLNCYNFINIIAMYLETISI